MILLDTHAWLWLASEPTRLGPKATAAARRSNEGNLGVSVVSGWEVATKVSAGKLSLDRPVVDWVGDVQQEFSITHESISMAIALRAGTLGRDGFHGDRADRIIVATSLILRCPLATLDGRIREWAETRNDLSVTW